MSHARRSGDDRVGRPPSDGDETTAKIVWMEIVRAAGPLPASALADRTLLAESAVESALEDLEDVGLCAALPADDRRPRRYVVTGEGEPGT